MMKSKQLYLLSILGAAILVTAIVAVALIATRPAPTASADADFDANSGLISPAAYNAEFVGGGRQHFLLDVRTPGEYSAGHIPNSVNISVETLAGQLNQVPTDQPIIVYCRSGNRSAQAASILRQAGYTQVYDLGGVIRWQAEGYPLIQ